MYVLIALFIAGLAIGGVASWKVTADAYKADMLNVANAKIDEQNKIAVEVAESVKRVHDYRDEQEKNLSGVINERDEQIAKLEKSERDARAANRGLFVSAGTCASSHGVPSEAKSAEVANSRSDRVRLSSEDAENIRRDYSDAQAVVIQYQACRKMLSSLVNTSDSN